MAMIHGTKGAKDGTFFIAFHKYDDTSSTLRLFCFFGGCFGGRKCGVNPRARHHQHQP
jgi:hypothetical protein